MLESDEADDLGTAAASHSGSALRSLAPSYDAVQHETYVKRLQAAVQGARNRNIALTGSYGTGKSSVLDEFCHRVGSDVLRLAISTLGANNEDTTLTNRLQKEVVKQLLYSAEPTALRNSRFKRIRSLTRPRAAIEALSATGVVGLLLFLTGNMPTIVGTEPGRHVLTQVAAWLAAGLATALIVMMVRLTTFDRFVVSTLGGAVTLKEDTSTYFDEYLDEIVHYFDTSDKHVVVFEDLDRFDDPLIFEALRELNTLLNNTEQRRSKGTPLRFVYAVKDSLFERLGRFSKGEPDAAAAIAGLPETAADAVAVENERANRTKFFDLVIPVVPFISHRNARELLADLLTEAQITGVDRMLVDLVAKHTTDMRLLINLRNEYLVFAERLLDTDRVAPDLTPSHLFALVAYKMFHMEDFERIARRSSQLDGLYADSRDIVQREVDTLRKRLRDLSRGRGRAHSRSSRALAAGTRLKAVTEAVAAATNPKWPPQSATQFDVDGVMHDQDAATTPSFWSSVAAAKALTAQQRHPNGQLRTLYVLTGQARHDAFPEASDADAWDDVNERDLQAELASIEAAIARFRGAGFEELLLLSDTFSGALDARLTSEMARELVRQGFLTRHFATYAAQFYGDFTGVDVVTFIMQTVETNSVDIDYEFTTAGAVANLLSETGDGFTKTVSALNIDILDHLLRQEDPRRDDVASQIIDRPDESSQAFLSSYLTAGEDPEGLVRRLAALGWPRVLVHLGADEGVPDDARSELIDAAITEMASGEEVQLDDSVRSVLVRDHTGMSAFATNSDARVARVIADLIDRLEWTVPDLAPTSETLRGVLVERNLYDVTAANLRLAADGEPDISLDTLAAISNVYNHVLASPGPYLAAVAEDGPTSHAIESSATLIRVLNDVEERWTEQDVVGLLKSTSSESALADIHDAPQRHWDALAEADLVQPSLSNVSSFLDRDGVISAPLGNLLLRARRVDHVVGDDTDSDEMRVRTAVEIINASTYMPSLQDRISIVSTLDPVPTLPAERIDAPDTTLLASLLDAGLVDDTLDVFLELKPSDWTGMDAALRVSESADGFITPELLDGYVEQVLASSTHRDRFGPRIVRELSSFTEDNDHDAIVQAGEYAFETGTPLSIEEVRRVAGASDGNPRLTVRLLHKMHLSLPPAELAAVLTSLGAPYTGLTTGGRHFDVPNDDEFRAVFERLKAGGICDVRKRPRRDRLRVTPAG